jgi:hypothetical protein
VWNWTTLITIGSGQATGQDLPAVIDDEMPCEAREPINCIFATLCQPGKHAMVLDAAVVTDHQLGRIDKREAVTAPATGLQLGPERDQDGGDQFYEALGTDQVRKLRPPVFAHLRGGEGFEIPGMGVVELDENGHEFTCPQLSGPLVLDLACLEQGLVPGGSKGLPKISDRTKEFQYTHRRTPFSWLFGTRKCTAFSERCPPFSVSPELTLIY